MDLNAFTIIEDGEAENSSKNNSKLDDLNLS